MHQIFLTKKLWTSDFSESEKTTAELTVTEYWDLYVKLSPQSRVRLFRGVHIYQMLQQYHSSSRETMEKSFGISFVPKGLVVYWSYLSCIFWLPVDLAIKTAMDVM